MTEPRYPDINGNRYDWSSVEVSLAGDITIALTEVTYSDGLEPGDARGTRSWILASTRGEYKPEAGFTIHKVELQRLIDKLAARGPYMEQRFDMLVSYADTGQPTLSDKVPACRIKKISDQPKQGSEPVTCKVDLHVGGIIERNGRKPVADAP
jgi:hypothetical protein